mmetsp:Transcript_5976/g.16797  ORF Transcript_5976/g.16797 Transcript_5976/m.16797 type:complete len:319 (+) Transcript_5976:480-1436(+)
MHHEEEGRNAMVGQRLVGVVIELQRGSVGNRGSALLRRNLPIRLCPRRVLLQAVETSVGEGVESSRAWRRHVGDLEGAVAEKDLEHLEVPSRRHDFFEGHLLERWARTARPQVHLGFAWGPDVREAAVRLEPVGLDERPPALAAQAVRHGARVAAEEVRIEFAAVAVAEVDAEAAVGSGLRRRRVEVGWAPLHEQRLAENPLAGRVHEHIRAARVSKPEGVETEGRAIMEAEVHAASRTDLRLQDGVEGGPGRLGPRRHPLARPVHVRREPARLPRRHGRRAESHRSRQREAQCHRDPVEEETRGLRCLSKAHKRPIA